MKKDPVIYIQEQLDRVYGYGVSYDISSFGYQSTQMSFVYGLHALKKKANVSAAIHEGWSVAARTIEDPVYSVKPEKRDARLALANTSFDNLSEDEKAKDRLVACAIAKFYEL